MPPKETENLHGIIECEGPNEYLDTWDCNIRCDRLGREAISCK